MNDTVLVGEIINQLLDIREMYQKAGDAESELVTRESVELAEEFLTEIIALTGKVPGVYHGSGGVVVFQWQSQTGSNDWRIVLGYVTGGQEECGVLLHSPNVSRTNTVHYLDFVDEFVRLMPAEVYDHRPKPVPQMAMTAHSD